MMNKKSKRFLVAIIPEDDLLGEIKYVAKLAGYHFSERIPPHITIMPPINIPEDRLIYLRSALRDSVETFLQEPIRVGPVESFLPKNPAVFLRVTCSCGKNEKQDDLAMPCGDPACQDCFLYQIAAQLSIGGLEPPPTRDSYQFIPHITIGHAKNITDAEKVIEIFNNYSASGYVNSIALLEQDLSSKDKSWSIVDEPYFGKKQKVSFDGGFLSIGYEKIFSPYDLAAINLSEQDLPQALAMSDYIDFICSRTMQESLRESGSIFINKSVVVALRNPRSGELLAAALTRVTETVLHAMFLFVQEPSRGLGLGRILMRQLDKLAHEMECKSITMSVKPGIDLIRFLEKFGYIRIGEISSQYFDRVYRPGFTESDNCQDIKIMAKDI